MRTWIIQFLVGRFGSIAGPVLAALVAYGVSQLSSLSPDIAAQVNQEALVAILWGLLVSGINYATNHWLTRDAKVIQAALVKEGAKLDIDGWVGDDTVRELQAVTGLQVKRAYPVNPTPANP